MENREYHKKQEEKLNRKIKTIKTFQSIILLLGVVISYYVITTFNKPLGFVVIVPFLIFATLIGKNEDAHRIQLERLFKEKKYSNTHK